MRIITSQIVQQFSCHLGPKIEGQGGLKKQEYVFVILVLL